MEIKKKEMYLSPEVTAFEVKTEGVICGSESGSETLQNYYWNTPENE